MDSARSTIPERLYTLKQTAEILAVTVDTLLEWNDSNILKPTITQDGKVGYSQEQIDKFLAIQQLSLNRSADHEKPKMSQSSQVSPVEPAGNDTVNIPGLIGKDLSTHSPQQPTPNQTDEKVDKSYTHQKPPLGNSKLRAFGVISSFLLITVSLSVMLITQQNKIRTQPNYNVFPPQTEENGLGKVPTSEISSIEFSESTTPSFLAQMEGENPSDNYHNDEGITASENKYFALYSVFSNKSATTTASVDDKATTTPVLGFDSTTNVQIDNDTNPVNINNGAITSRASRPNSRDTKETVFDENGNIKGETIVTNLFPSTLGMTGAVQSDRPQKRSTSQNIMITFLALGTLTVLYIFKNSPALFAGKTNANSTSTPGTDHEQKILEIDQKTDGTVVLNFLGKEHKVSKPELNSETDRFIERLMGLTKENVKKIQYDILKDEKIRLDAPLSKLVTRLGFVGVKRDLFFPRTSKNKILFRKGE